MSQGKFRDMEGREIGRLKVLCRSDRKSKNPYWYCLCSCGALAEIRSDLLAKKTTKSCGCFRRERVTDHGATAGGRTTRAFACWSRMHNRCKNPSSKDWKYYGGRGVSVCARWSSFKNFLEDMGDPPAGLSIDRIDPNGDYEPGNCRWADALTQSRNRRRTGGWKLKSRER